MDDALNLRNAGVCELEEQGTVSNVLSLEDAAHPEPKAHSVLWRVVNLRLGGCVSLGVSG